MKYYTLEAVVKNQQVKFGKKFASRDEAIDYMFNYLNNHYMYNVAVNEEIHVNGDKHNVEYVLDNNHNLFRVNRVVLA